MTRKNQTDKTREELRMEATLQMVEGSIDRKERYLETIYTRTTEILTEIQNSATNVATPAQQAELKKLEDKEKQIIRRLEELKFQQATLQPCPGIPYRGAEDEYDEWYVVDQYEKETADAIRDMQQLREQAHDRDNDRSIDR